VSEWVSKYVSTRLYQGYIILLILVGSFFPSSVCTVRGCQVVTHKFTQHYTHTTVSKTLIPSSYYPICFPDAHHTINIGEEIPRTSNTAVYRLSMLSCTHRFISRTLLHRTCLCHTSHLIVFAWQHGQPIHSVDVGQFVGESEVHCIRGLVNPERE